MICCVVLWGIDIAVHFPYATDKVSSVDHERAAAEFYKTAYTAPTALTEEERQQEAIYVQLAERAAKFFDIEGQARRFIADYGLKDKRILDIGAGRGYLQDLVPNYVGLDISPTASRYFHKPFVLGTATGMPFHDNEFDAA